jgi:hypothetical protein
LQIALGTTAEALRLFDNRFRSAVKINDKKATRAKHEMALLQQDRAAHPIPGKNHRREPRWEGSEAQKLLNAGIKNNAHSTLSRAEVKLRKLRRQRNRATMMTNPKNSNSAIVESRLHLAFYI